MTMQKLNVPWLAVLDADHGLVGMVAEGDVQPAPQTDLSAAHKANLARV
jgi:hypothetical protein